MNAKIMKFPFLKEPFSDLSISIKKVAGQADEVMVLLVGKPVKVQFNLDSAGTAFFNREKGVGVHFERLGQYDQLGIGDATELGFDFRERSATQFQTQDRATGGKHLLRHPSLVTQFPDFRPDDVSRFGHALKSGLTLKQLMRLIAPLLEQHGVFRNRRNVRKTEP